MVKNLKNHYLWYDKGMGLLRLIIVDSEFALSHRHFLEKNVSDRQKEKAFRYKNEIDQIRSLVSSYLMNQLSKEEMKYKETGKPYFENGPFFNVSHSGKYIMMAISDKEIGIDVEENIERDMSPLMRIFNEAEAKIIKEHADFYYLWCAKESLIKCMGSTIGKIKEIPSLPLNGVKTFKGKDYECQAFLYEKHIVSITRESAEEFKIKIEKVSHFPVKLI